MSTEVQKHGFTWQDELLPVYGVTESERKGINYTSKLDLPAELNRLDGCGVSIKTSGNINSICMGNPLRVFDATGDNNAPIHMTVIHYTQDDATNTKNITTIIEMDLTGARPLMFGSLTRSQIEELDRAVKSVPQKKKPSEEERKQMYSIRDSLQPQSGAIHLDIKCNSTQSRVQCHFNQFQKFIEENPERVVAKSTTNEFRGGAISAQLISSRRIFKKKLQL